MKKTTTRLTGTLWLGALCLAAQAADTPKLQFDRMIYDFGKTQYVDSVTGVFKFTNVGDGVLKLEAPKPSCGCTLAELKPDTLKPGESGELPFTLHLGQTRALFDKRIAVKSNDPQTPLVSLTIKADYTPLYEVVPMTLAPKLDFGVNDTTVVTTISRTDGKPLGLGKIVASKPWITATLEPGDKADASKANIKVAVQRDGSPRRFNEFVHIYTTEKTNSPVSSIYVYGQMMGEVSLSPEALYWSVTDLASNAAERPEALVLRRVAIRSTDGKPIEVSKPQSTIKGIKVELVPKEAGKVYELVARLDEVPASTVSGNVSFETSVASQPRIEVPVIVHVFKQ